MYFYNILSFVAIGKAGGYNVDKDRNISSLSPVNNRELLMGGKRMKQTFTSRMDALYQQGLEIIKENMDAIQQEWELIVEQYKRNHFKIGSTMEKTMHLFSDLLFHDHSLEVCYRKQSFKMNPFIITFLENIVHKVIHEKTRKTSPACYAVHYFFTKFYEEIMMVEQQKQQQLTDFLQYLVQSYQLPIEMIVTTEKDRDHRYSVKHIFTKEEKQSLAANYILEADTIYELIELLYEKLHITPQPDYTFLPIPADHMTLIIYLPKKEFTTVTPFIHLLLKLHHDQQKNLHIVKNIQSWKDSVILFNEKVMSSQTYSEAIQNIARGFVEFLPFKRSALFSYNKNNHEGFGLYGHQLDQSAIQKISENIQNLPLVHKQLKLFQYYGRKLKYIQPLYIPDVKGIFPDQYVEQFHLHSVVVVPIYLSTNLKLLGAAILDQGPGQFFKIDRETYFALIKFGQSAGEILAKYDKEKNQKKKWNLSPREREVLQLLSEGASTFEAAIEMDLSEYTVRDYISSIIQKMNVKNRTEAVARAIREGII